MVLSDSPVHDAISSNTSNQDDILVNMINSSQRLYKSSTDNESRMKDEKPDSLKENRCPSSSTSNHNDSLDDSFRSDDKPLVIVTEESQNNFQEFVIDGYSILTFNSQEELLLDLD
ncbi:hypothetical protein Ciccas_004956 [Cichlidogyrus casuarinus]|uniref:Uncharacterized protein n=1 Tax=Cichlidogyrus casuarinus TaxID=1844966 RepID=A0ABD2QAZ3_9PLAT